jgi:tRNA(fMet)-specific endonuclease VapC
MLDTNICVHIINKRPKIVLDRLQKQDIQDIGISCISLGELEYGIHKSQKPYQNRIALMAFITPLEILNFDSDAACAFGKIRFDLERKGKLIGQLDMLIAAHALSKECILVTNNVREFARIPDLKIENWAD